MKRYTIAHRFVDGLGVNEDLNGEWVRYEDIKGILQYKDQLRGYKLEGDIGLTERIGALEVQIALLRRLIKRIERSD